MKKREMEFYELERFPQDVVDRERQDEEKCIQCDLLFKKKKAGQVPRLTPLIPAL